MQRFIQHHTEDYAWFIDFAPHVFYLQFSDLFKYQNPYQPSLRKALLEAAQGKTIVLNASNSKYDRHIIIDAMNRFNIKDMVIILVDDYTLKEYLHDFDTRWFPHKYISAIAGNLSPSVAGIAESDIHDFNFWQSCTAEVKDLIVFYDEFKTP
jgi:hypothetical protein